MLATIALIAALCSCSQDISSSIQKLRSEKVEEREQATQELHKLGKTALSELEKVTQDRDSEVAARARGLVRRIKFQDLFGIDLNDPNDLPVSAVVEWAEKKSGRKFVFDESLGLQKRKIRVQPELFEAGDPYSIAVDVLKLADLAVTPSNSVPGAVEVCFGPIAGKKGVKVYKAVEELPKANEFCTLILHPRHISPRTAQAVLINVVSFPQNCLSVEDSGTLVLSDYASVLRKCAELVKEVDVLRSFRVSVAILEGRSGKEASVPEPFRNLRLTETTGSNHFTLLGTGSAKLDRVVQIQQKPGLAGGSGKNVLRIAGPPAYLVEFGGSVRAEGGPTIEGLTVSLDQEPARKVFEARFSPKDDQWAVVGTLSTSDGSSLVVLARAVPD